MTKLYTSLLLVSTLIFALACASGDDFVQTDYAKHTKTGDGGAFPTDVRDSFKAIPGGQLTAGNTDAFTTPADSSVFSTALLTYTSPVSSTVKALEFMETEVTIEMYVGYMNTPELETPTLDGGTETTENQQTDTGSGSGTTSGTSSGSEANARTNLFRPIMQDERYCGIYMIDSSGGRIVFPITSFTGFITAKATVDPFINVQRSISRMQGDTGGGESGGDSDIVSFTIAPTRQTYPMVFVSQQEALQFAKYLGSNYRLPTVSEWLFASKGGQTFDFPTGSAITESLANYKGNFALANSTFPVKSYAPNGFGLYDMAGNVYEATMYEEEDRGETIPNNGIRYVMGGSYQTTNIALLTSWYVGIPLVDGDAWAADYGFRIVYDATRISTVGEDLELK